MGTAYNFDYDVDLGPTSIPLGDAGNISDLPLEEAHAELQATVCEILSNGSIPFVVGGGNDQSYPNAAGLLDFASKTPGATIGVINIDAHFDVRPLKDNKAHSGSPFRQLLESNTFLSGANRFIEFAAQASQCSVLHYNYIMESREKVQTGVITLAQLRESKGGPVAVFKRVLDVFFASCDYIFISFDIDAISGADAPGVSCPATVGLSSQEALDICLEAGKSKKVKLFDVSEFNPKIEEYRTGRLVANMFYHFAMGIVLREPRKKGTLPVGRTIEKLVGGPTPKRQRTKKRETEGVSPVAVDYPPVVPSPARGPKVHAVRSTPHQAPLVITEEEVEHGPAAKRGRARRNKKINLGPEKQVAAPVTAPKPEKPPRIAPVNTKTTVHVANLPFTLSDEAFGSIFSGYHVKSAHVVRAHHNNRSKGYGFVEFESEVDQVKAMNEKQGTMLPTLNGEPRAIVISIVKPNPK